LAGECEAATDMHRGRRIAARAGRLWHEVRVGHQASAARQVLQIQKDGGKDIEECE